MFYYFPGLLIHFRGFLMEFSFQNQHNRIKHRELKKRNEFHKVKVTALDAVSVTKY